MTGEIRWGRLILIVVLAVSLLANALTLGAGVRLYELRQALLGAPGMAL